MSANKAFVVVGVNEGEAGVVSSNDLRHEPEVVAQPGGVQKCPDFLDGDWQKAAENRHQMSATVQKARPFFDDLDETKCETANELCCKSSEESAAVEVDPRLKLLGAEHWPLPQLRATGRPRVVTAEVAERIVFLLSAGFSRRQAAAYVGISTSTIANAAARDAELAQRLRQAEELCELQPELTVMAEARKNWRAAAWYMQYRQKTPRPLTQEEKEEKHREKLADIERKAIESQAFFDGRQNAERRREQGETPAQAAARRARQVAGLEVDDALPKREEGRKRRGR
jgi:hypothetical protein